MRLKRSIEIAGGWFLPPALLISIIALGFYMDRFEVDQSPTPRVLYNLAVQCHNNGDDKEAREYLELCANYNDVYGTEIKINTFPHGYSIKRANDRLKEMDRQDKINRFKKQLGLL